MCARGGRIDSHRPTPQLHDRGFLAELPSLRDKPISLAKTNLGTDLLNRP